MFLYFKAYQFSAVDLARCSGYGVGRDKKAKDEGVREKENGCCVLSNFFSVSG